MDEQCVSYIYFCCSNISHPFLKPRLGIRRMNGVCPPSKLSPLLVPRAFEPLCPRPQVLPVPDPMPRPTRFLSLVAPSLGPILLRRRGSRGTTAVLETANVRHGNRTIPLMIDDVRRVSTDIARGSTTTPPPPHKDSCTLAKYTYAKYWIQSSRTRECIILPSVAYRTKSTNPYGECYTT